MILLERIRKARRTRDKAEAAYLKADTAFRTAIRDAHPTHSWRDIADVSGLRPSGCRYLAEDWNAKRKAKRETA